ncbi:MAG TPA: hypothetical protein PLR32_05720 [candidate division Zixibacteria bacterium]|nr:hypothetical protein [candidate division Zixibacteria bacterium]MDD4916601.1 hypothetical protein [candidate division Zixibacteria bacterium]MDM7973553.1 hypothetical protein [candidate division Zixibacteria bacterium]HOD65492.1 hypothetical protein [candidate division Zixibacteria bacterium]HOZ06823.1 hypothetical protein [candidate division Zixibacteria bacterium]
MLDNRYRRGFSQERLAAIQEPRVRKDSRGYFLMSLSENTKVYFEDFYRFLERTYAKARAERSRLDERLFTTAPEQSELIAYYRARGVIVDLLMQTIIRFYTDGGNFGVVMSPWCFGTVVLEKLEVYRERLSRGEVEDPNIPDYPYYTIRYLDEIHKAALLELFDFPEKAFQMRWQYSELLKRYSQILSDITTSLNSVLGTIKNYGS